MDNIKNTVLNIEANPQSLAKIDSLLERIAQNASKAEEAVSRVGGGMGGGPGGGGGGGGGGGAPGGGRVTPSAPQNQNPQALRRGIGATIAAMAMGRVSSLAGGAIGGWYGQESTLAGGEVSGSPFAQAQAVIQARTARGIAGNQAIAGGVSMGTSAMGMAGGAMLAASLTNPAGWALAAGAALLEIANRWGESAANAQLQVLAAKQQAAVSRAESVVGKRTALSEVLNSGYPFGGLGSADEMGASGSRYGYSATDAARRALMYRKAGGRGLGVDSLLGLERGLGVGADTAGRFERGFLPGGGATRYGTDAQTHLETTIETAMRAGIDASRMAEYLDRIASYQEALAEKGIQVNAESFNNFLAGFEKTTGIKGTAGLRAGENMRGFGQGMLSDLTNMIAPQDFVKGLAMAETFRRGKTLGGASRILESDEQTRDVFASVNSRMPREFQPFMMSQITGLAPSAAAKMRGWNPGEVATVGNESLLSRAETWRGTGEAAPLIARAERENVETLAMSLGQLAPLFAELVKTMQTSIANMDRLAMPAMAEARQAFGAGNAPQVSIPSWQATERGDVPSRRRML